MFLIAVVLGTLIAAVQPAVAQNAFTPDQVKFESAPMLPGAQVAVLEGDPGANSGDFTVRLKLPPGYKIPPHWHPKRENVTVLAGELKVGMGDKFDETKMASFAPGSFAYLEPSMHHYAMAAGDTVIQIHGSSPLQINYVNPADDPMAKK